ncbi:MAG TPA: ATP-binding protein [Tepidisphaeraceae bacterium]
MSLLNSVSDAVVILDPPGRVLVWNAGAEGLLGYSAREMAGELLARRIDSDAEAEIPRLIRQSVAEIGGEPYTGRWLAKNGRLVDVAGRATAVRSGRRLIGLALVVHDVAALHEPGERQRLEQEVVSIAEEERRRIGRDLHDSVCQELVAAALEAEVAASGARDPTAPETDALRQLARSLRHSAEELRQLARGLAPADLNPEELRGALDKLTTRVGGLFGISCTMRWGAKVSIAEGPTATLLFRIAQEAISNSVRHGRPRNVSVSVTTKRRMFVLTIRDDGVGIPPNVGVAPGGGPPPSASAGIGLASMHYRAKMAGGQLDITPARPRGTVVTCTIPIPGSQGRDRTPEAQTPGASRTKAGAQQREPGPTGGRGRNRTPGGRMEALGPRVRRLIEETRALRDRSRELRMQMRMVLERAREMNASSFESRAMARHVFVRSRDAAGKRGPIEPTNSKL